MYILILSGMLLLPSIARSQQSTQYSLYHLDKHLFNPAYAGVEPELTATAIVRNQWLGINGSPLYQQLSLNAPLIAGNSGIGLNFENDNLGLEHNINASVSYSHRFRFSENGFLAAGIRGVWSGKSLDGTKITTPDGKYEPGSSPDHKDGLLPVGKSRGNIFGIGAGILLRAGNFEVGAGVDNIVPGEYKFEAFQIKYDPTWYLNAGWLLPVSDFWQLKLDGLARTDGTLVQTDAVVKILMGNNMFAGSSFRGYSNRTIDAISVFAGIRVMESLTLAASYDLGLSDLRDIHSGSIEFGLRYSYGNKIFREKLPVVIYNPRY